MLDDLQDFVTACVDAKNTIDSGRRGLPVLPRASPFTPSQDLYCAKCGGARKMDVFTIWSDAWRRASHETSTWFPSESGSVAEKLVPSLFEIVCRQCKSVATAVLYQGHDGPELAVFPDHLGGLSTPHTPEGVAYYLDQAHRAQSAGALSAAVAMYRSALELLLFDQGYTAGMCGAKIAALESAIGSGTAPDWARQLDSAHLRVIKKLGDGAIHTNDGDIARQQALDSALIAAVKKTFAELLDVVYERPYESALRLAEMEAAEKELRGIQTPEPQ